MIVVVLRRQLRKRPVRRYAIRHMGERVVRVDGIAVGEMTPTRRVVGRRRLQLGDGTVVQVYSGRERNFNTINQSWVMNINQCAVIISYYIITILYYIIIIIFYIIRWSYPNDHPFILENIVAHRVGDAALHPACIAA